MSDPDETFTQREILIEWTRVEVTPEIAMSHPGSVENELTRQVKRKYAAAGDVPVRIEWLATREVISGVPERIRGWTPTTAWFHGMPRPSQIFCQGRPDLPGAAIQYVEVNEPR